MDFYPDKPKKFIHKSSRYRCPHCGETGNRRWRTPLYLRHNYLLNEKGGARYECVFCNKKSYAAKTKNEPLYKKIIVYIVAIAFLVLIPTFKYLSGDSMSNHHFKPFEDLDLKYYFVFLALVVIGLAVVFLINKLKLPGWTAWVTSQDGTPAPGRRIKLSVTSDAKQLKKIKELAIYDIISADDHQGGVIYAQCEEITEFYVLLRIIKCKGYDAPVGDDVKILVGKKQIEAKVTEETEPAKPINSTEEQPQ